jgi:hypothetical protein
MCGDRRRVPSSYVEQHPDGESWIASVLCLSRRHEGRGTAFWEHRPTALQHWWQGDPVLGRRLEQLLGLRWSSQVDRAARRGLLTTVNDEREIFAFPPARTPFTAKEDDSWKLLKLIPSRYNRLLAYPVWQIHSGVDDTSYRRLTVENMRLTMNLFVNYPLRGTVTQRYPAEFYRPVRGLKSTTE